MKTRKVNKVIDIYRECLDSAVRISIAQGWISNSTNIINYANELYISFYDQIEVPVNDKQS